jgi:hypothetical protein
VQPGEPHCLVRIDKIGHEVDSSGNVKPFQDREREFVHACETIIEGHTGERAFRSADIGCKRIFEVHDFEMLSEVLHLTLETLDLQKTPVANRKRGVDETMIHKDRYRIGQQPRVEVTKCA